MTEGLLSLQEALAENRLREFIEPKEKRDIVPADRES
jgi:hypothetical protein